MNLPAPNQAPPGPRAQKSGPKEMKTASNHCLIPETRLETALLRTALEAKLDPTMRITQPGGSDVLFQHLLLGDHQGEGWFEITYSHPDSVAMHAAADQARIAAGPIEIGGGWSDEDEPAAREPRCYLRGRACLIENASADGDPHLLGAHYQIPAQNGTGWQAAALHGRPDDFFIES